jgi:HNH endonuclease
MALKGCKQIPAHVAKRVAAIKGRFLGAHRSPATEIKSGQRLSPATEFAPGGKPWNAGTKKYSTGTCEQCGREFQRPTKQRTSGAFRFCSLQCAYQKRSGPDHGMWRGGRHMTGAGYMRISIGRSDYQYEHILIAERVLGRRLKCGECVHHINGVKHDNRNTNLLICTGGYHRSLERRMAHLYQQEHFT